MEEEQTPHQHAAIAREELIAIIKTTFSAPNQQQQKIAQERICALLKTQGFMEKLLAVLFEPGDVYLKSSLDIAVASLIKKSAYDLAKSNQNKSYFVQTLVRIILNQNIDFKAKQLLQTALQYQFIEDQENQYRRGVIVNVLNALIIRQNLVNFEGLIMICIAYMNSLNEIQQQIDFFLNSLQNMSVASINYLNQVLKLTDNQFVAKNKLLILKINKLFDYIELSVERILDEEIYLTNELKQVRQNKSLITILQNYMTLFNNNGSIISLKCPQINETKRMISNIISKLYSHCLCPPNIFNNIYITFLVDSQYHNRDGITQSILINCFELLNLHLQKKYYYKLYADNLEQTILALFMYSTTSKQEYEALDNNPEQFSDIAEYYVNGNQNYYNLKVKAGILIQTMAEKIDGALRQMLEIVIVILASSLQPSEGDSELMIEIKEETSKFDFYGLSKEKKLQTSFMMLSTISLFANRRNDISQTIYSLLITQHEVFSKLTSSIVVLRLIRCLGCYPSALYYEYIQQQIKKGRVFTIQGLRCFQKIIKTNKYNELFKSLALIIANVIELMSVTDPIMQLIINSQFQQMLKASSNLFEGVIRKINTEFYANKSTHQHQTLICFNLLYSLLKKETQPEYLNKILGLFYEWVSVLQMPENHSSYIKYDQKIVEIFEFIMVKLNSITQHVDNFVKYSLQSLSNIQKGSQFFRFYSMYISHSVGCQNKLETLFLAFSNQLRRRFSNYEKDMQYNDGISYFCFLMSAIISNYCKINIPQNDLKFLLKMAEKLPTQYKQYPLIVFLSHLYQLPYPTRAFLNQNGFYTGFLNQVVRVSFQSGIIKKIFILSMIKLLQIEQQIDNFKLILIHCINHLKHQISITQGSNKITKLQPRVRTLPQDKAPQTKKQQEHIQNDNELVDLFVKFKHPFHNSSDFDQFKVIFWQNDHQAKQLSPQIKADLKLILETQWVQNKTRRIVQVKK